MASPSSTARLGIAAEAPPGAVATEPPPVVVSSSRSLAELRVGERATVRRLTIERPVARRLMELGLLPGTAIEIVRIAPLGDPIEIGLRGYRLSIRRSEAARVEIIGGREDG